MLARSPYNSSNIMIVGRCILGKEEGKFGCNLFLHCWEVKGGQKEVNKDQDSRTLDEFSVILE